MVLLLLEMIVLRQIKMVVLLQKKTGGFHVSTSGLTVSP